MRACIKCLIMVLVLIFGCLPTTAGVHPVPKDRATLSDRDWLPHVVSKIAPLGKAGARGGINIVKARDLVLKTIAANNGPCGLVTPRSGAFGIRPAANGWLVSVKAIAGKAKGWSTWNAAGKKATPVNAAAKLIARGCKG